MVSQSPRLPGDLEPGIWPGCAAALHEGAQLQAVITWAQEAGRLLFVRHESEVWLAHGGFHADVERRVGGTRRACPFCWFDFPSPRKTRRLVL